MPDASPPTQDPAQPLHRPRWSAINLLAGVAVGAVLYLGQAIFVPLALAALLAFVLDPVVGWLRRIGLPRTPAVVLVMLATVAALAATSFLVAGQLTQLAHNLPTYQSTVQGKLRVLRKELTQTSGGFGATTRMLDALGGELDAARRDLGVGAPAKAPMAVTLSTQPRGTMAALADAITPLLGPLATLGAVLLFLMFVLIERHDMRDRLLRLAGTDLHRSTDALDEAGQRVSRYLAMQLLINAMYAVPLAAGLWFIGVPGALLWGLLGGLLRFVPYAGPVVAALFPLTLAFAVDPGWQMVLWTLALVVTLELISNNIIEPWLYGASTGLSSLAIVVSAMFWTLLWGPVGLVLATPMTVCLAVLGRHVTPLAWLDVLLGNAPAFDAPTRLYQRLLAGDVEEAIALCETQARADGVLACYSTTAVPALALAARAHARSASAEHRHRLSSGMGTLLHSLRDELPAPPPAAPGRPRVLCVGARWEIDTLAAEMLVHALAHAGIAARVEPATAVAADHIHRLDLQGIEMLCLSSFSATPEAQVRNIARRLKRSAPGLRIVAGLWNAPPALLDTGATAELGVDAMASTATELVQRLQSWLDTTAPAAAPDPDDPPSPQEARRLQALRALPLDAPALRAALDRAALRAADVFNMPMAMVTLVDAHDAVWQGAAGLDRHAPQVARRHTRDGLLCNLVVTQDAPLLIEDADRDARMADDGARRSLGLRSYAGAPLRTPDGLVIGALCVVDTVPRTLGEAEGNLLQTMAASLMDQLQRLDALERRRRDRRARAAADTTAAAQAADPLPGASLA